MNASPPAQEQSLPSGLAQDQPSSRQQDDASVSPAEARAVRAWKESPFAIGYTLPTWQDERVGINEACLAYSRGDPSGYACSAYICSKLGAGRVGNMFVLRQTEEDVELASGQRTRRPRLVYMVGPYWTCMAFGTIPLILIVSFWAASQKLGKASKFVALAWLIVFACTIFSLLNVACRNPGIMYRYKERPSDGADWTWNDQALTFRPKKALYDPTCAVVVEDFDHVCPWTGTAIGKRNLMWFYLFQCSIFAAIVFDIALFVSY
jgi:DHHC palmitoyltransferase